MLTALIFGTDAGTTALVQQLCSLTRDVCVYRTLERYPQSHETMRLLNSFSPEVVFVGVTDEAAARNVERDIRSIQPSAVILGVSAHSNHRYLVESTCGGFSVCPIPCEPEEFRTAIFQALESRVGQKTARVFAFQPAKAGSGATTTALFVAHILSTLAEKRVLVLECDLHAGPISMLYNLRPAYSIMDALEDSHRLTDAAWNGMVSDAHGFDVLSSVSRLGMRPMSPWNYQRLLSFVRSRYEIIIGDLPEVVDDATEVIARAAQAFFIVTAPSSPALYLAARRRYELEARGVGAAKVKYIVNRKSGNRPLPPEAGGAIDAEKIAAIPFDSSLVDACELKIEFAGSNALAEFTKVAEFCCGHPLLQKRSGLASWLESWTRGSSRTPELYSTVAR